MWTQGKCYEKVRNFLGNIGINGVGKIVENVGKVLGETGRRFVEHVGNMLETSEYVGNKVGKTIKHHPTGIYLMAENTS